MIVEAAVIKLYASWVHSLKEKRMVVKSIIAKVQNKFNVSISEIDAQDIHKTIILGIACVADCARITNSTIDNVINFIEGNSDAQIMDIQREIR
ncbi:MAG: DUF503 domain-containing protein [Clostridiales bacterium]|nr:DUF503 domain-containing protein [Clostridiales bacterium]